MPKSLLCFKSSLSFFAGFSLSRAIKKPHERFVTTFHKANLTITDKNGQLRQILTMQRYKNPLLFKSYKPPKKKNPDLIYLMRSPIRVIRYKGDNKLFIYSFIGEYLTTLDIHDVKRLFSQFIPFLKEIKNENG